MLCPYGLEAVETGCSCADLDGLLLGSYSYTVPPMSVTDMTPELVEYTARAILRGLRPMQSWDGVKEQTRMLCREAAKEAIVAMQWHRFEKDQQAKRQAAVGAGSTPREARAAGGPSSPSGAGQQSAAS
jgi:hypothetical protein